MVVEVDHIHDIAMQESDKDLTHRLSNGQTIKLSKPLDPIKKKK